MTPHPPPSPAPDTSGLYSDCTLCDGFPRPRADANTPIADVAEHFAELIAGARLSSPATPSVIVLVPGALRGYELFTLDPGPSRDMVLAAIGRYKP